MSAEKFAVTNGGAALIADANDPNTTPPPEERIFTLPHPAGGIAGLWFAAEGGGAPDIEVWAKLTPSRWFAISLAAFGGGTTFTVPVDAVMPIIVGVFVADAPLFVRILNPNGATAVRVGTSLS